MTGLGIVADTQATTDDGARRSVAAKQSGEAPAKPPRKRATARKKADAPAPVTPTPPVPVADSAPVAQNVEG